MILVNALPEEAIVSPTPTVVLSLPITSDFGTRLAQHRKAHGLTQQALAARAGLSLIQIHRYEAAGAQPTLEALKSLALALQVSTDELVFGPDARGPDEDLRLQFEAVSQFGPEDKQAAKAVLDALILKHQARRWTGTG